MKNKEEKTIEKPISNSEKLKTLVEFLEYEEAYTYDILSQGRIRKVLKELGYWKTTLTKKSKK